MAGLQPLATARLTLSPVEPEDAADTARLMTRPVSRMLTTWPEQMTVDQAAARIAESIAERHTRLWNDWAIRSASTGELAGWIGVGRKDVSHTRLNIGLWLGEAYQGQRLGEEAVSAVMGFAAGCATAYLAEIYQTNQRSIALFERLGFRLLEEREMHSPVRGETAPSFVYERLVES